MPYKATAIADYLIDHEQCSPTAAKKAGARIAGAWNDREFWMDRTLTPITDCLRASGLTVAPREVVRRLELAFGTWISDVPAPKGAPPR